VLRSIPKDSAAYLTGALFAPCGSTLQTRKKSGIVATSPITKEVEKDESIDFLSDGTLETLAQIQ